MKLQVCIFNLLSIATIVLLGSTGAAKEQYLCQSPNESSIIALEYINSVDEQYCLLGLSGKSYKSNAIYRCNVDGSDCHQFVGSHDLRVSDACIINGVSYDSNSQVGRLILSLIHI